MGLALLKEAPKLKEWPHFSGEGEYDHMEFIRGIDMIKEDFELPEKLATARFNTISSQMVYQIKTSTWTPKLHLVEDPDYQQMSQ
ncbi:hypothetical protein O181_118943 [Austropuccinia psidii MF-1]|uniref:Uncharacterized protein n=1 Tax=Austropuccinia psidii MF-1 TaxID=1389203 RepID=A0A9Q3PYW4_9BASI|nr:hypothetical protein [Austropuccinia psidii MF-1]